VIEVETKADLERRDVEGRISVSAETGDGVEELRELLVEVLPAPEIEWVIREG
jgi:50S ribosomal subunit-associated GTPase HflX